MKTSAIDNFASNRASNPPVIVGGESLLVCENLTASYGRIQVIFGLSLTLHASETVVVLGPNGAGKSSLFGAIGGTVQQGGRIDFCDADISSKNAHSRARARLAYVPEGRKNLFLTLSVRENLDIGLQLSPVEKRAEVMDSIIELFPILAERMKVDAGMLSGGEQQMLAIGVGLGRQPKVMLLDEPSQGLAPAVFDILEKAINELKARGIGVLLAEQNLALAARLADRYLVLSHGHLVASGHGSDLSDQNQISSAYFNEEGIS